MTWLLTLLAIVAFGPSAEDPCAGFIRPDPHPTGHFVYYGSHDDMVELRGQVEHQNWEMGPMIVLRMNEGRPCGPCIAQYYKAPPFPTGESRGRP